MKKLAMYTGNVPVVEKGEKGATERFREWDDIPEGESLQSGADGDTYIDYVVYQDDWYVCILSHYKNSQQYKPTNGTFWEKVSEQSRIATKLLLATKGFIKNLQVDEVIITDQGEGKGNTLLRATKDGIECKQGTFNNVDITGTVNATSGNLGNMTISGTLGIQSGDDGIQITKDGIEFWRADGSTWAKGSYASLGKKKVNYLIYANGSCFNDTPVAYFKCTDNLGALRGIALATYGDVQIDGSLFAHGMECSSISLATYNMDSITAKSPLVYLCAGSNIRLPAGAFVEGAKIYLLNEGSNNIKITSVQGAMWVKGSSGTVSETTLARGGVFQCIWINRKWHLF